MKKKTGFFEVECVSLSEIYGFEHRQHKSDCRFVSQKSMMTDTIASVYAVYGEIADPELQEYVKSESAHGYDHLKELYHNVFKTK